MGKNLTEHLIELFRSDDFDDVYVETETAYFSVWEGHPLKVNGEDFSWEEFNTMLSSLCNSLVTCDGTRFQRVDKEFLASNLIYRIEITLDDNVPEYMEGIIRIGSIISYDEDDNMIGDHQDLVDNAEFHNQKDMKIYVAEQLAINKDNIEIAD